MNETRELLTKALPFDIIKVTFNANSGALDGKEARRFDSSATAQSELLLARKTKYLERLDEHALQDLSADDFSEQKYPRVLFRTLGRVAGKAFLSENKYFMPLASFYYKDGQQMLTACGIVLERSYAESKIISECDFNRWPFFLKKKWADFPTEIQVPFLTQKERLELNMLPSDFEKLPESIEYLSCDEARSYMELRQHYPIYAKITL